MKLRLARFSALLLSLAITLPAAAGQLYKWTDASGRVQYSDTPPPDRKTETLKGGVSTSSASGGETTKGAPSTADHEQAFRKRRAEAGENEEKLAKENADKQRAEENCKRARGYLASLERGRVATTNEKGDREYYDDAKLANEKEQTRKDIAEFCKS
jgi:Domain of unknown function (DUF4124)